MKEIAQCKICNTYHKRGMGLSLHVKLKHNVSAKDYAIAYENLVVEKCVCGADCIFISIAEGFQKHCGNSECQRHFRSLASRRPMSDEAKKKLSAYRSQWLKDNPEKNAWRLGNKQSWAEKFFEEACKRFDLDKQHNIVREYSIYPFFIDFAFIDAKTAVEVDGAQHDESYRKQKDIEKDKLLRDNGWRVFRVPARQLYSETDSDKVVAELIKFIGDAQNKNITVGFKTQKEYKAEEQKAARITQEQEKQQELLVKKNKILTLDFSQKDINNRIADIIAIKPNCVRRWLRQNMSDVYDANRHIMRKYIK